MNCSGFENILADFEEGKLPSRDQLAAQRHLSECARCRRLLDVVRGSVDIQPEGFRDEFARSILECTSGPVCPAIESRLCSFVDRVLNEEESQLVALHLEHCSECRPLASVLEELSDVLPAMSDVQPDEKFAGEIVGLTSGRRSYRRSLGTKLVTWWNAMVRRPRFALEAAYTGTLVLVLLFSVPFLPFRSFAVSIMPGLIQPAAGHIAELSQSAKVPVKDELTTIELAGATNFRAVSKWLGNLGQECAQKSVSAAEASLQSIRKWQRKQASTFASIWTRCSSRISWPAK